MKLPKVTIQIPTYNQRKYIKEALASALAQDYDNLQIIVADDCSPDYDIFDYLKEYKHHPKVLIHRNEKNLGRVGNYRNTLFNLVEGEWFINLDGDDSFDTIQFLASAMHHIVNNKCAADVVGFEFNHKLDYIKKYITSYKEIDGETIIVTGTDYLIMQKYYHNFMHANTIFNVAAAKNTDFYNLDILSSDFFSAVKLWTRGDIILSSKKIFSWNLHGENATLSESLEKIEKEKLAIIDFKKYGRGKFKRADYRTVINTLEYILYRRVFHIYKTKNRDYNFYKYIFFNFRLNKYFIGKLKSELFK